MSSTVIDTAASENTCVVCFKTTNIFSIGECDHPVCYECSTRMRVLCRQNECPICRQDLSKVYFTRVVAPFRNFNNLDSNLFERRFHIFFDSVNSKNEFQSLLEHKCNKCHDKPLFRNFASLKDHMRREHELFYCDLCVENLRIFTKERRCYTRSELGYHRRKGDPDDRSHRGHPLCQFCEQRYMDNDELYRHLRRDHLFCHFCDADGFHQYYSSYNYLRDHFRSEHFLCEEGNCINEQFTTVYRSDIDLKAHKALMHSRSLGKAATKQARTLELEFTLAPRPVPERSSRRNQQQFSEEEFTMNSFTTTTTTSTTSTPSTSINTDCIQEFPTLSGAPSEPTAMSIRTIRNAHPTFNGPRPPLAVTDENFPALGLDTGSSNMTTSSGPSLRLRLNQSKSPPNVSIQVNHRHNGGISSQNIRIREDFPTLGGGSEVNSKHDGGGGGSGNTVKQNIRTREDFPSLGGNGCNNHPIGASWVNVSGSSSTTSSSSSSNQKKQNPAAKNKNKVTMKNDDFPALSQSFNVFCTVAPKTAATAAAARARATTSSLNKQNNEEKSSNTKNNKKKNKTTKNVTKKEESSTPAVPSSTSIFTKNQTNGLEQRKRSELHIEPAVPPPGFPAQPPPGFANKSSTNTGPPPGFSTVTLNSIARASTTNSSSLNNGLTFTNSSGQSYAILPESTSQYTYSPPADFSQRNKNLVTRVMKTLQGADASLETFRQYSTLFRQGLFTAESFYNHCLNAMGSTAFEEIFPELLALLPDINKQKELWHLHRTTSLSSRSINLLEECATCHQILTKSDLRHHLRTHSLENNFPALGTPSEINITNNAWSSRK